jgi:ribosome-associated protein
VTAKRESDEDAAPDRPSKSARKRAAHEAQDLGEALLTLREVDLAALALPEELLAALREAHRISSRAGLARQRQYIGKLMRTLDLQPIRTALAARGAVSAAEAARLHRVEEWRERLIAEGAAALAELQRSYPAIDASEWQRRITAAAAERERERARASGAGRELFRALRALFATMP